MAKMLAIQNVGLSASFYDIEYNTEMVCVSHFNPFKDNLKKVEAFIYADDLDYEVVVGNQRIENIPYHHLYPLYLALKTEFELKNKEQLVELNCSKDNI